MLVKSFLTFLCVVHSCVNSLTSQDPKTGVSYDLALLGQDFTPYRNERERRTTHWESQAHSNLDDSTNYDRDKGQGQISYPSLLEEPSLLRVTTRFETSGKSSKNFDVTGNTVDDENSSQNHCVDYALPSGSIFPSQSSWLSFLQAQRNLENARNLPFASMDSGKLAASRCRRTIDGWTIQEPFYVEEPRWIVIEINGKNSRGHSIHQPDPFYVTRGKRSLSNSFDKKSGDKKKSKNLTATKIISMISSGNDKNQESSNSVRRKRETLSDTIRKYLIDGSSVGRSFLSSRLMDKIPENGYVQPRDKHSDILDILNEPFFISRGKKNSLDFRRSAMKNRYTKELVNFATRRQFLDTWLASEATKNCDLSSPDCALFGTKSTRASRDDGSGPIRDRRGDMEELLKETDPFYVARGKKSELLASTEITNDNLSIQ